MTVLQRKGQRGLPQGILHGDVRAAGEQVIHHIVLSPHRGERQRRVARLAGEVDGQRGLGQQELGDVGVASEDRRGQGRVHLGVVVDRGGRVKCFDKLLLLEILNFKDNTFLKNGI